MEENLLDPSLLDGLTTEQRQEALAAAAAAKRAEERAEQRALERAIKKREEERQRERQREEDQQKQQRNNNGVGKVMGSTAATTNASTISAGSSNASITGTSKVVFVSKRQRQKQQECQNSNDKNGNDDKQQTQQQTQQQKQQQKQQYSNNNKNKNQRQDNKNSSSGTGVVTGKRMESRHDNYRSNNNNNNRDNNSYAGNRSKGSTSSSSSSSGFNSFQSSSWADKERQTIRKTYLGSSHIQSSTDGTATSQQQQQHQANNLNGRGNKRNGNNNSGNKKTLPGRSKKATFRFEWDNTDDTLDDHDPLYAGMTTVITHGGRKRKHNSTGNNNNNNGKRTNDARRSGGRFQRGTSNRSYGGSRYDDIDDDILGDGGGMRANSLYAKPLDKMTSRDWRIFRENYEIVVKGGKAPPPLRTFREGKLHSSLVDAIENVMHYKDPTPIQRQAIPIGLQRRDLIGIAETGSGKTCAFGVPLLQYILQLPATILNRVAEEGPLALVMAPTRELALQIHGEFQKLLSRQSVITACAIVGGQSIQHQAQQLRDGAHVVVGTPGRMNDCIEMAYLVLNQCCYIVLDEADRMIDMGFAPQMESILDAMGGLLKSENEQEAYQQELNDLNQVEGSLPTHRLTAMFSATMPLEVEKMAKRYLRHPAVISIGDQDSSKNARIVQRVIYINHPSQKEKTLRELILDYRYLREKVIVFVNEKKHADGIGRMIEKFGRQCVVLHGGKSQEQREENLEKFRNGGYVLVATDVAGRGLDISNVAHVINYDLPSRSIDAYCHRIGRTGRAGKEGLATSIMTDDDVGIMAALKSYLESTNSVVPEKLARNPAANANASQGNLIF